MHILSIETSCDETALALVEATGDLPHPHFTIHKQALLSQIEIHKEYGGVFPNLAKREHAKNLIPLLKEIFPHSTSEVCTTINPSQKEEITTLLNREPELCEAFLAEVPYIPKPNIDAIAVTYGPGLEPALWVGINFAKALHFVWNIPVIPTNHMEGHIYSILLHGVENKESRIQNTEETSPLAFPALALLISGGHTELVSITDWGVHTIIGQTRDDAVGEAFDKVARTLGLPYPGGPEISRLAEHARAESIPKKASFTRPMLQSSDYDFSFSGLKTAVLYYVRTLSVLTEEDKLDIVREFEDAVTDILIKKTIDALDDTHATTLIIAGGVASNTYIKERFTQVLKEHGNISLHVPHQSLATDNAVMISAASYIAYKTGLIYNPDMNDLKACGTLSFKKVDEKN